MSDLELFLMGGALNNERAEEEPAESFSLPRVDNFRRCSTAASTTPAEILLVQIFLIWGVLGAHFMIYKNKRLKGRNIKTDLEKGECHSRHRQCIRRGEVL